MLVSTVRDYWLPDATLNSFHRPGLGVMSLKLPLGQLTVLESPSVSSRCTTHTENRIMRRGRKNLPSTVFVFRGLETFWATSFSIHSQIYV